VPRQFNSKIIDSPAHIIQEVIDNAVDEALAGFATKIDFELLPDGFVRCIADNGRGISIEKAKKSNLTHHRPSGVLKKCMPVASFAKVMRIVLLPNIQAACMVWVSQLPMRFIPPRSVSGMSRRFRISHRIWDVDVA
jgi:hypothetical protein